ncbi:MAG: TM2 domain-containing protein [Akkermansiaceae bacterium]|nr:TM2 domain-containing protein [Akkermansiaceae bacterium]
MSTEPDQTPHQSPQPPLNSPTPNQIPGAEKKMVAGILGILLGCFGVHKFYLGYQKEGIIMLIVGVVGFVLCGIPTMVASIIGIVEGVLYLTKPDEEFVKTYVTNKKPWF